MSNTGERNISRYRRGTSALEILLAITLLPFAVIALLALLGYRLLTPAEAREAVAEARVWRDKRRELSAAIAARRPK